MPENAIAAISNDVATGRRMNGSEMFTRRLALLSDVSRGRPTRP